MLRRAKRGWELIRQYALSALLSHQSRWSFDEVHCFCLFVGYPRSGHTLVGSLLDAHRHVVIGLELDALRYVKYGFRRNQLFYLLAKNSEQHAEHGRVWTGYNYYVPGQWQGRAERIWVIGDKRGGDTARRLLKDFKLLDRLREVVRVPVKIVHVVRNPLDNISTMVLRGDAGDLGSAIALYYSLVNVVERVRQNTSPEEFITVHHEQLIANPRPELERLCSFLGVDAPAPYLAACAAIVFDAPRQTRHLVTWNSEDIRALAKLCGAHDFLECYIPMPSKNEFVAQ